jgi:RNA recognition motif-containing protein
MNIYVGQLPYTVTETELQELFSEFGEIESVNLIMDYFSGRSKGFAFIDMPSNSEADQAIKALNKSMFQGREIKVNQVQPQNRREKRAKRRFRR